MQDVDEKIVARIKALLETRGCTEAEASARIQKAQELLEKYGLEMATLSGTGAKRSDKVNAGGLYTWQRRLWDGVARLNFCVYFSIKGLEKGSRYENRLIGSHANVVSTEIMAQYLQDTIEKLAQEWAYANFYKSVFVREAIAYREGMAARIVEKLRVRRNEVVSEARRAEERRKADAHASTFADAQTSHALTILDVISSEEDFNNDYLNNWEMGTTARNRAEQEAKDKAWREQYDRERAARDAAEAADPALREARMKRERAWAAEWARKEEAAQRRRNKTPPKVRYRKATAEEQRAGLGSYYEGYRKGADVGIDEQVKNTTTQKLT